MATQHQDDSEGEAFLRQLVLPEEERCLRYPTMVWSGGFRWFRSPNVIPIDSGGRSGELARSRRLRRSHPHPSRPRRSSATAT
jgi:hypothetical protein